MVFHTGGKGKTDNKVLLTDTLKSQNMDRNKSWEKKDAKLAASIVFNVIMFGMLVGCTVYLMRYRHRLCDMQIQHDSEWLDEIGIPYEIQGCHAQPIASPNSEPMMTGLSENSERVEGELMLGDLNDPTLKRSQEEKSQSMGQNYRGSKKSPSHRGHKRHPHKHGNKGYPKNYTASQQPQDVKLKYPFQGRKAGEHVISDSRDQPLFNGQGEQKHEKMTGQSWRLPVGDDVGNLNDRGKIHPPHHHSSVSDREE